MHITGFGVDAFGMLSVSVGLGGLCLLSLMLGEEVAELSMIWGILRASSSPVAAVADASWFLVAGAGLPGREFVAEGGFGIGFELIVATPRPAFMGHERLSSIFLDALMRGIGLEISSGGRLGVVLVLAFLFMLTDSLSLAKPVL